MAAEPWLEGLSSDEYEWNDQPESEPSLPSNPMFTSDPAESEDALPTGAISPSRIPLPTSSAAVASPRNYTNGLHVRTKSNLALESNPKSPALAEYTPSQLNVAHRRSKRTEHDLSEAPINDTLARPATATVSDKSAPSWTNDTVQIKEKENVPGDTPEWKRRIVNGEIGAGEQAELFGPRGLESVFKPPPSYGMKESIFSSSQSQFPWSMPTAEWNIQAKNGDLPRCMESFDLPRTPEAESQHESGPEGSHESIGMSEGSRTPASDPADQIDWSNFGTPEYEPHGAYDSDGFFLETKHMLSSPVKDPYPKRRRTLQSLDNPSLEYDCPDENWTDLEEDLILPDGVERPMTSGSGQLRKIDQWRRTVSGRPMSRSSDRSNSHSHSRSQSQSRLSQTRHEASGIVFPDESITGQIEMADAIADELASFGGNIAKMANESRKGSITTQDFLNEATKIMSIIRAKGKNKSTLSSVLESEAVQEETTHLSQSSIDDFERPPSRKNNRALKAKNNPRLGLDLRVTSQLREFQDKDDLGLVLDSSVASLHLETPANVNDMTFTQEFESLGSPANIRILDHSNIQRKRKHSGTTEGEGSTNPFTQTSTSSGNRGFVQADKVSHLIPENVGLMKYDPEHHRWYKEQDSQGETPEKLEQFLDEDPFNSIDDLSVDELEEMMRTTSVSKPFQRRSSTDLMPSTGRPISRISEHDEEYTEPNIPAAKNRQVSLAIPPDINGTSICSFHLAPLSDFTVQAHDQSLQLEETHVGARENHTAFRPLHGEHQLAVETLVRSITDVEPYEPYWEHVQRLSLAAKGLSGFHRLSEFCPRIDILDVSDNNACQLDGLPGSIRTLKIQRNYLSGLTPWSHLSNLQYLDISGNNLDSLHGINALIHLRELKVNDNRIKDLEGLKDMDALIGLRARGNQITAVDLQCIRLPRLRELDLGGNKITSVSNLHALPSLISIVLDDNELQDFLPTQTLHRLEKLRLSTNALEMIDLSLLPSLRSLYADRNCLEAVDGLENCHRLEVLSLREQTRADGLHDLKVDVDLTAAPSLRKAYLSANNLSKTTLRPRRPCLSLQLLDVASCALSELCDGFGQKFPNLRALNLNFNALDETDVAKLAGTLRLSRLLLVGNRISRMRKFVKALHAVNQDRQHLTKLDLRGNAVCVGYYPIAANNVSVGRGGQLVLHQKGSLQDPDASIPPLDPINLTSAEDTFHAYETLGQAKVQDPFVLAPADPQTDLIYQGRLDNATRLKRRVYELMLLKACRLLTDIDGLTIDKEAMLEDRIGKRLAGMGCLVIKGKVDGGEMNGRKEISAAA